MTVHLVGGGVDSIHTPGLLDPFLVELTRRGEGRCPRLAVVLVDVDGSGKRFLPDYVEALGGGAGFDVVPVFLRHGSAVDSGVFDEVDGIVVAGGPVPAYLAGLGGAAGVVRERVGSGVPYLGFSAGAMVAAAAAIAGGYRLEGMDVCPEDWSEGLDAVTLRPGIGLAPFTVDVHGAQAGTLGRAVALVEAGQVGTAVVVDEDTCLSFAEPGQPPEQGDITGSGSVWTVRRAPSGGGALVLRQGVAGR